MLSFRKFLYEMPQHSLNGPDHLDDLPVRPVGPYDREEHTDHAFGNYQLVQRSYQSKVNPDERHKPFQYVAHHIDKDEPHFVTRGGTTPDGHFIANETRKHTESEVSAPDFYKEILRHGEHKGIQSGGSQTEGGQNIWHRLAHEHSDVEVTHHEHMDGGGYRQIPLHMGDNWHKNFDDTKTTVFRMRLK